MSWFKTLLLLAVLGMTWVDCGRRPAEGRRLLPKTALEAARQLPDNGRGQAAGPLGRSHRAGSDGRLVIIAERPGA